MTHKTAITRTRQPPAPAPARDHRLTPEQKARVLGWLEREIAAGRIVPEEQRPTPRTKDQKILSRLA